MPLLAKGTALVSEGRKEIVMPPRQKEVGGKDDR